MQRAQLLRQLVLDSQYVLDEQILAEAIVARATTRCLVPGAAFRNDVRSAKVRSFRPSKHARSFRRGGLGMLSDRTPKRRRRA